MGLNKENTDNKVQRLGLVLDYLREHENVFSSLEKDLILANLNNDGSFYGIPNVCLQLYDELGILPDDINLYKEFANLVNKQFDIKHYFISTKSVVAFSFRRKHFLSSFKLFA